MKLTKKVIMTTEGSLLKLLGSNVQRRPFWDTEGDDQAQVVCHLPMYQLRDLDEDEEMSKKLYEEFHSMNEHCERLKARQRRWKVRESVANKISVIQAFEVESRDPRYEESLMGSYRIHRVFLGIRTRSNRKSYLEEAESLKIQIIQEGKEEDSADTLNKLEILWEKWISIIRQFRAEDKRHKDFIKELQESTERAYQRQRLRDEKPE